MVQPDTITIITHPAGLFSNSRYRTFRRDKVTIRKQANVTNMSCSACSWMPDDAVEVHATGEIIHGQVLDYGI